MQKVRILKCEFTFVPVVAVAIDDGVVWQPEAKLVITKVDDVERNDVVHRGVGGTGLF